MNCIIKGQITVLYKFVILVAVLMIAAFAGYGQDTITYHISFPNAVHHEANIAIEINGNDQGDIIAVMSKSSPGRYAEHNFAKNVYSLKAIDADSVTLRITKLDPNRWQISGHKKKVIFSYTLYANHADGTYSGIDEEFANLNMPATLMWMEGMENNPVKIIFHLPDTGAWKIATQLVTLDSAEHIYFAPGLQYLMDSPCILGNFSWRTFKAGHNNETDFLMAINSEASEKELDQFAEMTKQMVHEQETVFGELPEFMENRYIFLCSYGPGFHGDGMEHRNSTMISASIPLAGNLNRLIGTVSHEFFHVWNIERIRPKSLEPFDFTRANMSGELWFGEGFTSYYGDLTLCRAGIIPKDRYIRSLSSMINYVQNVPGWRYGSPVYMSEMAPLTDDAVSVDEDNFPNTFLSYYTYGEIIALALDLSLRTQFEGVTLDDLMKAMWQKYGKTEKPYTNKDIQATLAEVCGNKAFADKFFNDHIYGNTLPDFESLFDKVGYKLIRKNPGKTGLGFVRIRFEGDTAVMLSQPLVGTSLYESGISKGDLILSIDEQPVTDYAELNFIIGTRKPGDIVGITYSHLGKLKKSTFKIREDRQVMLVPKEKFSIRVTDEEKAILDDWLGSKVRQ